MIWDEIVFIVVCLVFMGIAIGAALAALVLS